MDWLPINWQLIANPLNWVIVILMLAIAAYGLHLILPQFFDSVDNSTSNS